MDKNYKTLELDLILEKLAAECSCEDAAELAKSLKPVTQINDAEMLLTQTEDAFSLWHALAHRHFQVLKT